jgi:hypothetical protein
VTQKNPFLKKTAINKITGSTARFSARQSKGCHLLKILKAMNGQNQMFIEKQSK